MKSAAETTSEQGIQRVVLFSSTLNQTGGGDRLLLELARGLEIQGVQVTIIVLDFHPRALFEGQFAPPRLIVLGRPPSGIAFIWGWLKTVWKTRQVILAARAQHIVAQSETNAIFVRLALCGHRIPYSIQIFGQMFQFPHDLTKYARVFRKHLPVIIESMEGYRHTIPREMPRVNLLTKGLNEIAALARYIVVRGAHSRYVLSRQVAWETSLLYQRPSTVLRGAYSGRIFNATPIARQHGTLLSLSRLVLKKNIHLAIEAFALIARGKPSYKLLIGGTGPERVRLESMVHTLGLANQITFIGYVPEAKLWEYYQSCAAFVMLDVADYNITLYEALALGSPVIVSLDQEIDEALAQSALLHPTSLSAEAIAAQMCAALERKDATLSATELNFLQSMSWDNYARRVLMEISHAL